MCLHTRVTQSLSQMAQHACTYLLTSFYGIKRLGIFLLFPLDGVDESIMGLSHSIKLTGTHLYSCVGRSIVRVTVHLLKQRMKTNQMAELKQ